MISRTKLAIQAGLGLLLLTGFVVGRYMIPGDAVKAFNAENKSAAVVASPSPIAAGEAQTFYLSDFKTGFSDGYNSGLSGDGAGALNTTRTGYNDGFKQGFAEGYQARVVDNGATTTSSTIVRAPVRERVVYRTVSRERATFSQRRRDSKLKTILTIAAPAAIGAGVGGAFGGGKGAGVGALLGGGGGALYHLIRNR